MGVIDKAAVVAMLEEWRSKIQMGVISIPLHGRQRADAAYEYELLGRVKDAIGILEVKEKEIDLEKEIKRFTMSKELYEADSVIKAVAEHFFELGLKAKGD